MAIIDEIVKSDGGTPRKQRHWARRIWERITEEHGNRGGYTQVCAYVRQLWERDREAYVPPAFEPSTARVRSGPLNGAIRAGSMPSF